MSLLESTKNTRAILRDSLRFIRSDVPVSLTEKDREWLISNDIRTVIDLRGDDERLRKPSAFENDSAFRYAAMPVTGGNAVPETPDKVAESYIRMADANMKTIVDTIMNAETGVLYFCNAGKDRTGVVTAVILSELGYPREYITADYLLSGDNLREELAAFAESVPDIDINVITPRAEYMETFLEWYDKVKL